jgi:uncharacterized membrane protein (UPF0127 family)
VKKALLIVLIGFVGATAMIFFRPLPSHALHATLGREALVLEVADTDDLRKKGLSGHVPLRLNGGMLFVFTAPEVSGFWMKDMLFPIDIIWFDENRQIVDVWENAQPSSYPEIRTPRLPAQYVLELPSGFFASHHLQMGDVITLPTLQ